MSNLERVIWILAIAAALIGTTLIQRVIGA